MMKLNSLIQKDNGSDIQIVFLPVGNAEVTIVGEVALVGPFPSDSGPGSATDLTPEGYTFSIVTCHITQRYKKLWRN